MRRINTEDGRYHAGDPSKGTKGTIVTMDAMNALQEEIAGFIESAGLELDATDDGQLLKALLLILKNLRTVNAYSITALPQQNVGPIVVLEASEVWLWNTSAYFTGYRSPLCGRPLDGHTVAPLISEVDAVGGTLSKTAYAGLWGYAQENGLVIASGSWAAGMHKFVDLGGDNFRIPDLRNQFRRYTGTDADTANA
ncbi:phage tail protein, partial [Pandoraea captiosa]|uniref:phage tail protein n=1 Tax=Pandoraea captiosa TaxID=2508302 RepID=UPI001FE3E477